MLRSYRCATALLLAFRWCNGKRTEYRRGAGQQDGWAATAGWTEWPSHFFHYGPCQEHFAVSGGQRICSCSPQICSNHCISLYGQFSGFKSSPSGGVNGLRQLRQGSRAPCAQRVPCCRLCRTDTLHWHPTTHLHVTPGDHSICRNPTTSLASTQGVHACWEVLGSILNDPSTLSHMNYCYLH